MSLGSHLDVACTLEHTPRLQLALDGLEVALEQYVIHNPTVEETLRNDPKQYPQPLVLKEVGHYTHTGIHHKEEQIVGKYL